MAMKKGLGRGLDALLGDYTQPTPEGVQELDIHLIDTNAGQPRKDFDQEKLQELADSIRQHGVVQPILLRQNGERYVIVAGERRFRAARLAGLSRLPWQAGHSSLDITRAISSLTHSLPVSRKRRSRLGMMPSKSFL